MQTISTIHTMKYSQNAQSRFLSLKKLSISGLVLLATCQAGLAQAAPLKPLPMSHGFSIQKPATANTNISAPVSKAPVRKLCPDVGVVSFKIVGKVPAGKAGDRSYRLRLQGVLQNYGDSYRGPMGKTVLIERPQGGRAKILSHQRMHNLTHGKQLMIGALTQPFSLSTEFLPDYVLDVYNDRYLKGCSKTRTRHEARVTRQMVRAALQH